MKVDPHRYSTRPLLWGYGAILLVGACLGVLGLLELRENSREVEQVVGPVAARLVEMERLRAAGERLGRTARGYVLTGDPRQLEEFEAARRDYLGHADALQHPRMESIHRLAFELEGMVVDAVERYGTDGTPEDLVALREQRVQPVRRALEREFAVLGVEEADAFAAAYSTATAAARRSAGILIAVAAATLLLSALLTFFLARTVVLLRASRHELERSHAHLERRNQDLDAFAGRVAHDLRNVLAPLSLQASNLARRNEDPEAVAQSAARLQRLSERSKALLEALLDFARAGAPVASDARASVLEALDAAREDLRALCQQREARIDVDVPTTLHVACEPGLLHTMFVNLLGNALKFLDDRPRREVRISARTEGTFGAIAFQDTGPGMSPEVQEQLCTPFYRAPNVKVAGTGLGLATVQRIVQAHGGALDISSVEGQGATFTVRLPRR